MKRWIHSSNYIEAEAFGYGMFTIQYEDDKWHDDAKGYDGPGYYIYYYNERKAGPFEKWIDAEDYVDENEEDLMKGDFKI